MKKLHMQTVRRTAQHTMLLCVLMAANTGDLGEVSANPFDETLKPLLQKHCIKCHGQDPDEIKGDVNLFEHQTASNFTLEADLVKSVYEAIDGESMPPDTEPALAKDTRNQFLVALKDLLLQDTHASKGQSQLRRLNRFQYNNTVRDLFKINRDVFALPEKLMTRKQAYLRRKNMPETVRVTSHALNPEPGMAGVEPFPKDLRASHGFDNQANQLTLSPLLLDAFLRLSVSIVESPDFVQENVGLWDDFFRPPTSENEVQAELRKRLRPFLKRAFRSPVDEVVVDRYVKYAAAKMDAGAEFTTAMKKVASAVLSSPKFYFRSVDDEHPQYQLASELSYYLWASCPDQELLDLAGSRKLGDPEIQSSTVRRMMSDPKIERFLDAFPAQWMQLENVLAATPDPKLHRLFSIDGDRPASLQMVLEPLLLFDAVFIEDRSITELISPEFTYQSDFLTTWYHSKLKPEPIDKESIRNQNQDKDEQRRELNEQIATFTKQRSELIDPIREQLLQAKIKSSDGGPDLSPYAVWEFDDFNDSVGSLHLTPHGQARLQDGMVHLKKSYLISEKLPKDLREKTLEVRFQLENLRQRGGGVMGVQGPGDFFDTIVIGERKPRHWISGSNGFSRTDDFLESFPEDRKGDLIHLTMVYEDDGTTRLYRDGQQYGKPFNKGRENFPKDETSILFGLRHLPAGGNKYLDVTIDRAALYDRALTSAEVAAAANGQGYLSPAEVESAMNGEQLEYKRDLDNRLADLTERLNNVPPNQDIAKAAKERKAEYDSYIRQLLRSESFRRMPVVDQRYGGIVTNAALMSMTSGPKRTHPIARGAWIIEVVFNDPPPPPPNDVPPLDEDNVSDDLTIRERFAKHRENPSCAGCHARLDPLGFALENYDVTGRWRDKYRNGRQVDSSGNLRGRHEFADITQFKHLISNDSRRFAKAFTKHLLRYALSRELTPRDLLTVDKIVQQAESNGFRLQTLIEHVALSSSVGNLERRSSAQ